MANRVISYMFRGDFSNLRAGLAAASRSVDDYSHRLNGLNREGERMRGALKDLGGVAGKFGLAAGAGLAAAVVASANFDKSMSAVKAATHESAGAMEDLRAAALKAGADTVYSATESASAIEELAKAGVSTKDILGGGLTGALNLAAAGAMDVGDAAETAATAMTQFKLSGDQVPHIADLLAAGAGKAQGEVSDLGMALKQSGLVAGQTGLTIEETVGTLSAFASAGLIGSDAGTSFKTMLQALTPSSKQASDQMRALGISAYDSQGKFIGMTKFAGNLRESMKNLSVEQQNAAMKTIFGSDAVRAAAVIYSQGAEGIQGWIDKTNDAGYAAETASTRLDNLSGDFEQLKGSLETALIGVGDGSQGPLRKLVQSLTNAVNAFNKMPPAAKSTASALLGITAVTGGALWFGTMVIGRIAATRLALTELGVTARITAAEMTATSVAAATVLGGGIAAVSVPIIGGTLSQMDSIGRSGDAAKATAKSYKELVDVLGNSNVGKYASDLGVDMNKLAQDLAVNGKQGEYAASVIDKLHNSSHGFSSLMKAEGTAWIPGYTSGTEKAAAANDDLFSILKNNDGLLGNTAVAADAAATSTDSYADATASAGAAAQDAGKDITDLIDAMQKQRDAALGAFDAVTQYGSALKDAQDAAAKGKRGIDANTEAGRENRQALSALAGAWNKQSDAVRNNGAKYRAAKKDFIDSATAMGVPIAAAKRLARQLLDVPNKVLIKVTAEMSDAQKALATIIDQARQVPRRIQTDYIVNQINRVSRIAGGGRDGDPSTPYATGGFVSGPGSATSDSIPAYLSNGEYVVRAAAVAKYGVAMMDSLNAQRFANGGIVGYASGGEVGGGSTYLNAGMPGIHDFLRGASLAGASLKQLKAAVERSEKAIDKEKQKRDDLVSSRNSFRADVAGSFTHDIFGNGVAGALTQLHADTNDANAMRAALAAAGRRGLDTHGSLYASLASSGDLNTAQQLSHMSRGQIDQFEAAYASRARATAALGGDAAANQYGAQIKALDRTIARYEKTHTKLEKALHNLEHRVEKGAKDGTHAGMKERDTKTKQRTRAGR